MYLRFTGLWRPDGEVWCEPTTFKGVRNRGIHDRSIAAIGHTSRLVSETTADDSRWAAAMNAELVRRLDSFRAAVAECHNA